MSDRSMSKIEALLTTNTVESGTFWQAGGECLNMRQLIALLRNIDPSIIDNLVYLAIGAYFMFHR